MDAFVIYTLWIFNSAPTKTPPRMYRGYERRRAVLTPPQQKLRPERTAATKEGG